MEVPVPDVTGLEERPANALSWNGSGTTGPEPIGNRSAE